jgi:hypothetical protein
MRMDPGETTGEEVKREKNIFSKKEYNMDCQQIDPRDPSSNYHGCDRMNSEWLVYTPNL